MEDLLESSSSSSIKETTETCALCQSFFFDSQYILEDEELLFCCKGCLVVYQILSAQGALVDFQKHPVYQQAVRAGLITNPHLQLDKKIENLVSEGDFQKLHISIQNMWCPSCAQIIHLLLMQESGVRHCIVDYATDLAVIEYTPRYISKEKILRCIEQMGYTPSFLHDPREKIISQSLLLRFIIAAFFSLNLMMFAYPIYATYFDSASGSEDYARLFAWLSFGGVLPVLFFSGWPIWQRCYNGLKAGIWGMETLVTLGVSAAAGLSFYELMRDTPYVYFDSVSVIILFVLLGKMIESKAKFSAKNALVKLSMAIPRKGRKRLTNGQERFVSIKEICPGDLLVVRMGERIVLDGVVFEGSGACDESLMTGEAVPVIKELGATVLAGAVLQRGYLVIKTIATFEESTLQQIIDMISLDIEHKSKYVRNSDQIAKWFVPLVFFLALMTALYCYFFGISDPGQTSVQTSIIRAVSILLIACPCAIGIAAPLAEAHLLNALADRGILVRNRGCLSLLGKETVYVLDKTGTVTEGKFVVRSGIEKLSENERNILKTLASQSLHPISVALCDSTAFINWSYEKADHIEEIIGKGMKGLFQGQYYYLGSAAFFSELEIEIHSQNTEDDLSILTTVYFAREKECLTAIILGDQLQEGICEFISSLAPTKSLLVSGDAEKTVAKVAALCHIPEWKYGYHPFQKKKLIDDLKKRGEIVAMIGDGMNDAPGLTAAHIGIAVVSASEMSIQVSDILLTKPCFHVLSTIRKLSLKGQRIIKQNLFWAFIYNVIGLCIAAFGYMTPLFAAFAMVISSLIVLMNAQRIR